MTSHLFAASLPLVFVAGLITFRLLLAPLLILTAWGAARISGADAAADYFRALWMTRTWRTRFSLS